MKKMNDLFGMFILLKFFVYFLYKKHGKTLTFYYDNMKEWDGGAKHCVYFVKN